MKRRKKVWLVLGPGNGLWGSFLSRMEAHGEADSWKSYGRSLRVVQAILEYDVPEKKDGIK